MHMLGFNYRLSFSQVEDNTDGREFNVSSIKVPQEMFGPLQMLGKWNNALDKNLGKIYQAY